MLQTHVYAKKGLTYALWHGMLLFSVAWLIEAHSISVRIYTMHAHEFCHVYSNIK